MADLSLRDRISVAWRTLSGRFTKAEQQAVQMLARGFFSTPYGTPPKRGVRQQLEHYRDAPWLRAIVGRIGHAVASTTWRLYAVGTPAREAGIVQRAAWRTRSHQLERLAERGDLREIDEHPLLNLLSHPNAMHLGSFVRRLTQQHLELVGEAFWLLQRDGLGTPVGVWPLVPHWVAEMATPLHPAYRLSLPGWQGEVSASEVLAFLEPDPADPYGRGAGTGQALADELETDEFACHDQDTECLTRRGWVKGLELLDTDMLATWNAGRDRIEYQSPTELMRYWYHGLLHHWHGRSVDACVTPNHRLWIESRVYHRPAYEAPIWHCEESDLVAEKRGRVFRWRDAGYYDGPQQVVQIPPTGRRNRPGSRGGGRPPLRGVNDPLEFKARDFARFLGYYISEGNPDGAAIQLAQAEGRFVEDIRAALTIFPPSWVRERSTQSSDKRYFRWSVHHRGLSAWLRDQVCEGAYNKRLPPESFEWPHEAQLELFHGLMNGDGCWRRAGKHKASPPVTYVTRSPQLANDIQRLSVQLGFSSLLRHRINGKALLYAIHIRLADHTRGIGPDKQRAKRRPTWMKEIPYAGPVWCASVPNGLLITRRNGSVLVSGNSKHAKAWFYNRARPDFMLWPEQPGALVGDASLRRLEEDWMGRHEGFFRAYRPHFLNQKVGVHEFSQDFRAMQYIEIRQHERDACMQIFGVPPEIFGVLQASNRATIDAADFLFALYVVQPRLEFHREHLQERLVPQFDQRLVLDYDSPVQADRGAELQAMTAAPWAATLDEWRARQGLEPLPDDEGTQRLVPLVLSPAGQPAGPAGIGFAGRWDLSRLERSELEALKRLGMKAGAQ